MTHEDLEYISKCWDSCVITSSSLEQVISFHDDDGSSSMCQLKILNNPQANHSQDPFVYLVVSSTSFLKHIVQMFLISFLHATFALLSVMRRCTDVISILILILRNNLPNDGVEFDKRIHGHLRSKSDVTFGFEDESVSGAAEVEHPYLVARIDVILLIDSYVTGRYF